MDEQQIKTAPYMGYRGYGGGRITWEAHLKAWEGYAKRYGSSFQSAETIAERGGFGASELDEFYPDWKRYIVK